MNLHFQMAVESHSKQVPSIPKRITIQELANRQKSILAQQDNKFTPDRWMKDWLKSKTFYLMDFPLNKAAIVRTRGIDRILSSADVYLDNPEPVVVIDINKKKLGQTPNIEFIPSIIVIEGSHVHKAARMDGRGTIKAWVGELAAARLNMIQADHDIGNNELQSKLNECLRKKFPPKKSDAISPSYGSYPWIQEVYALENYFIYTLDGDQYKQKFEVGDDREPTLKGEPIKVRVAYVNATSKSYFNLSEVVAMQAGAQPRHGISYNPSEMSPGSGVGPRISNHTLRPPKQKRNVNGGDDKLQCKCLQAHKQMKVSAKATKYSIQAKAPVGWENTVKHMKSHPEISNPYALTNWMKDEGYKSHKG